MPAPPSAPAPRQTTSAHRGDSGQPDGEAREQGGPSGYDAGRKTTGRKRHVLVNILGLLPGVSVTPADVQDRDDAKTLLGAVLGC